MLGAGTHFSLNFKGMRITMFQLLGFYFNNPIYRQPKKCNNVLLGRPLRHVTFALIEPKRALFSTISQRLETANLVFKPAIDP